MARVRDLMGAGASSGLAKAIAGTWGTVTAAGTGASTATVLSYETNAVTAAGSADGVSLPTAAQGSQPGDEVYVLVTSSTSGKVYSGTGETLNGSSSAITVAQNKMLLCKK